MSLKRGHEALERQIVRRMTHLRRSGLRRQREAGRVILPLTQQTATEQLIPTRVRRVLEDRIDREIGFDHLNRCVHLGRVL